MTESDAVPDDGYTAPASAIPAKDTGSERSRTLGECFRAFSKRSSPRVLGALIVGCLVLKVWVGGWSWRDGMVLLAMLAIAPFFEWVVHVVVLHARPRKIAGRTFDVPNAKEHRIHHEDPANLNTVLLPTNTLPVNILSIAALSVGVGSLVQLVFGAAWGPVAATALLVAATYLGVYEWSHFLMHSPYRPRSRFFRHLWKNHRLHHYKNEHHWFGVTSTLADHALGTAPEQSEVERSPTARKLHAGVAAD